MIGAMTDPLWPLFDLRLAIGEIELRLPSDAEIAELCAVARAGVHAPDEMPFAYPWTRKPSPRFEREFAQWHWKQRAAWDPAAWWLELAVFEAGRPIGSQALAARQFAALRTVSTGSWLGLGRQGRGIGKAMRTSVLSLAFDGLDAEIAETEAFVDNRRSAGVSRALGYVSNGFGRLAPEGVAREAERFRLTRAAWQALPRPPVAIEGLAGCRELFGG